MRKKLFFIMLCAVMIASFIPTVTFASEDPEINVYYPTKVADALEPESNNSVYSTINLTSSTKTTHRVFSKYIYGLSTSEASRIIDYIYARSRIYSSSGGVVASRADSSSKDWYAGAETSYQFSNRNGMYTRGNHTYRNTGYKEINHTTRDNF